MNPQQPGHGLAAKVGGQRNVAILAAGGLVAVVALVATRKKSTTAATGTATGTTPNGSLDSGPYDMWNAWQQEYDALQQQVDALQAGQTTASGPGTPKPPTPVPIQKPPTPTPAPGGTPPPPRPKPKPVVPPKKPPKKPGPSRPQYVTVHSGETLSGIGSRFGDSLATLKKLNPVYWSQRKYKDGNEIWAGDRVRVR